MAKKTKESKKPKKKKSRKFSLDAFVGRQLARLRFGVTYIQMVYYASVILGAFVLIINNIIGEGVIGWLDSILLILAIFIIEWGMGYYTEKSGVIKKDRTQDFIQNIPANIIVARETWKEAIIPQIEEMFEKVLTETLESLDIPNKESLVKEAKESLEDEITKS